MIQDLFLKEDWDKIVSPSRQWSLLSECCECLEPMSKLTKALEAECEPRLNKIMELIYATHLAHEKIIGTNENGNKNKSVKLAEALQNNLEKRSPQHGTTNK